MKFYEPGTPKARLCPKGLTIGWYEITSTKQRDCIWRCKSCNKFFSMRTFNKSQYYSVIFMKIVSHQHCPHCGYFFDYR